MKTFVVALATGVGLAAALPVVTALTSAVAEDWIATAPPVQLTQKVDDSRKTDKGSKARHPGKKTETASNAGVPARPNPIQAQAMGNVQGAHGQEPLNGQPIR